MRKLRQAGDAACRDPTALSRAAGAGPRQAGPAIWERCDRQTFLRLPLSAGSAGAVLGTFYVLAQVSLNSLAKSVLLSPQHQRGN